MYQVYPDAAEILSSVDSLSGLNVAKIGMCGPRQELMQPKVLEPAMVALEVAYIQELRKRCLRPDVVAGYSMGEIAALYCADVISLGTALEIAVIRGRILQEVSGENWRMLAVSGLSSAEVETIVANSASGLHLAMTAYNASDHVAIAGDSVAALRAEAALVRRGAVISTVDVAGPWHCPIMSSAADEVRNALQRFEFKPPSIPFYSSSRGAVVRDPEELRRGLAAQICLPIRWQQILEDLWRLGVRSSLEVGPGHVLTGFIGKTWPLGQYQARFTERENGRSLAVELRQHSASAGAA
jgi:[acyl-carrier-protein] S-malonyltransferase